MLFATAKVVWLFLPILLDVFGRNDAAYVRLYHNKENVNDFKEVPLGSMVELMPLIDHSKDLAMYGSGYGHVPNGPALIALLETCLKQNFTCLLLNWAKEASDSLGPPGICIAVANSKTIAADLANEFVKMRGLGLTENVRLYGFSLGASLMGLAGRLAKSQGFNIPWIFGLDPARVLCNMYDQVDKTSGGTVVIVHTDPGGLGTNESTGHINFRPNNGAFVNGNRRQPGCNAGYSAIEIFSGGNMCSHNRAWEYFCAAILNPKLFIFGLASSYFEFEQQNGQFTTTNYLWPVDESKQGQFYCTTSDTDPWGIGERGLYP